jgi:hypothetical protein
MTTNGREFLVTAGPLAVALMAALTLGGCSSSPSSSPSSASAGAANGGGGDAHSGTQANAEQFAQCMRAHGISNFPDPNAQGTFDLPSSVTGSPQFASADTACKSLAPPGALSNQAPTTADLNKATKFAACMRKHGETSFPDPGPNGKFAGGVTSVDPNSPQFKTAMSACRTLLPAGTGFGPGH